MKYLSTLLLCCLIMSACGNSNTTNSNQTSQAFIPTLQVHVEVSGNKAFVTTTTDMSIVGERVGMARKAGEGHIHMSLDDGEKETVTVNVKELSELDKGNHTIRVSLHNNDHTPYDVAETVEFEIK